MGMTRKKQRQANGSGSVWKTKDGRFGAKLTYPYHDPETGKTKRKRASTTRRTWEEAHRWLVRKQAELLGGPVTTPTKTTVGEYLQEWLRDALEPSVARNTYLKRESVCRVHLHPAFGHVRLSDLDARRVQALYSSLSRRGYSLAMRREVHVTLKMALSQAIRWGMLPRNPLDLVEAPREGRRDADEETEIRALTEEQAEWFFESAKDSRWRNYYVSAIRTGLRPGELLGLRWGDLELDEDPGSLRVRRTLDTHGPARFNPPKSPAARRTVALHWEAAEAFGRQYHMLEGEGLVADDLVFPSRIGTPMQASNLRKRHLIPDLEAAGLPRLTLHELRHTYASIALFEWRFPPAVVSEALGHRSITMTFDLYGHLIPTAQSDEIRRLNRLRHSRSSQNRLRDSTG